MADPVDSFIVMLFKLLVGAVSLIMKALLAAISIFFRTLFGKNDSVQSTPKTKWKKTAMPFNYFEETSAWREFGGALQQAAERGDADAQRFILQKMSYSMTRKDVTPQQKEEFKKFVADFVSIDPFCRSFMLQAIAFIKDKPGVPQSTLYKNFPEHSVEMMRYAFYYAEVLGELVRIKKGNSYRLYLPGQDQAGYK